MKGKSSAYADNFENHVILNPSTVFRTCTVKNLIAVQCASMQTTLKSHVILNEVKNLNDSQ